MWPIELLSIHQCICLLMLSAGQSYQYTRDVLALEAQVAGPRCSCHVNTRTFYSLGVNPRIKGGVPVRANLNILTYRELKWLLILLSVFVHGFLSHTRGTHNTKQLINTLSGCTNILLTKKSELEARCLRSASTVHKDKTGNKIDRKNDILQLTEGSYSAFY